MAATNTAVFADYSAVEAQSSTGHPPLVLVQWALTIACSYMVLFGRSEVELLGPALIIVALLATNLVIGRLRPAVVQSKQFTVGIGLLDTLLIVGSLWVAQQLSVELVLLCLGIVILAVAGLRLGTIAIAAFAMTIGYLVIVALVGSESPWRSSTLLRMPFLFTAAIAYAWFVEVGRRPSSSPQRSNPTARDLDGELSSQLEAIKRCEAAMRDGSPSAVETALREIVTMNEAMRAKLASA